jgi:hypothetical protein
MPCMLDLDAGHHMPTYCFTHAHRHQEVERRLANPFREWTWWMSAVRHLASVVQLSSKTYYSVASGLCDPFFLSLLWLKSDMLEPLQAGRRETALFVEFQAIVKGLLAGM